jgi:hypothetical protein
MYHKCPLEVNISLYCAAEKNGKIHPWREIKKYATAFLMQKSTKGMELTHDITHFKFAYKAL